MIGINKISDKQLRVSLVDPSRDRNGMAGAVCAHSGLGDIADLHAGRTSLDSYGEAIGSWLADVRDTGTGTAATPTGRIIDRLCDPIEANLLRTAGINPMALLLIEIALHGSGGGGHSVEIDGLTTAYISLGSDPDQKREGVHDETTVRIADGIWWGGGELNISSALLPATVLASAEGRPLDSLVSHPAFTGISVVEVVPTAVDTHRIITDHQPRLVTWEKALQRP